ncbi:MAG: hypothetical protein ACKOPE_00655 [Novosphingobium sp.]
MNRPGRGISRFQLYLRLVDVCFWLTLIFFTRLGLKILGILPEDLPQPFSAIYSIVLAFAFVLAPFLVCARFMRDEYAERIWHRAAQRFVYFLMVIPMLSGLALALVEQQIEQSAQSGSLHQALAAIIGSNPDPVVQFVNGFGIAIILFGIFGSLSFVCIYKWCLWRDAG